MINHVFSIFFTTFPIFFEDTLWHMTVAPESFHDVFRGRSRQPELPLGSLLVSLLVYKKR